MDLDTIFKWLEDHKSTDGKYGMPMSDERGYVNVKDLKKFLKKHEIDSKACRCSRCTGLPDIESYYTDEFYKNEDDEIVPW